METKYKIIRDGKVLGYAGLHQLEDFARMKDCEIVEEKEAQEAEEKKSGHVWATKKGKK